MRGLLSVGKLESEEGQAALLKAAVSGKGLRRVLALVAMQSQRGDYGKETLIKLLADKEFQVAGLAAMALGDKQVPEAIEPLVKMLSHSEWQLRTAAARGLELLAGERPKPTVKDGKIVPDKKPKPWVPAFYDLKKVVPPLVKALAKGVGSERFAILKCLHRLTKQEFGLDLPAWRAYVAGTDPKEITRRPKHPPSLFGVPLYGQRIVVIFDHSNPTDDPHPFKDPARMREICTLPNGKRIPERKLVKRIHLLQAHTKRMIYDLPKSAKFEIVMMGKDVERLMGKLVAASPGNKKKARAALDELKLVNGSDSFTALHEALDVAGKKELHAWKKGPDEIVFMSCGVPWLADVTDQESIGADIGLKAMARFVPIHQIGVGTHPWAMMQEMARRSGGQYVDLQR